MRSVRQIGVTLLAVVALLSAGNAAAAATPLPQWATHQIVARHSGHCLTGFIPKGSQARTAACGTEVDQRWALYPTYPASQWYYVRTVAYDTCLDVEGAALDNWAHVNHQPCGYAGTNRHWRLVLTDGGYYELINRWSNRCLDISWGWAVQYDCNNGYHQQFRFRPN
ncbi:RICIN domain-containing protein [Paractinoplanes rishiriensis]|uniref:Ricin B lectin domain-containing protein n=1 Tax=Paractinoplanes rishiriensis TaxID=1050105 RepID=A0A919MUV0_9ACTN|nr:RICIN domain-containing protein [Actinoplanes rishiriensis]GIF00717.1 hypothetical protein Ari01nite_81810 [Actinoplanes rishiriensis]